MDIRFVTADDYPALVDIDTSLNIAWPQRPQTPEAWAEADRNRDPRRKCQCWVAAVDGAVVGYGSCRQISLDCPPYRFYINVDVRPGCQRQGIGAALYDRITTELQPFGPRVLRADAFTNLPQGFPFLRQRGFYEAFRETPVHLDVTSFDPGPYTALETDLMRKGVVIKTLREAASDPGRDRKVYDLYWDITEDVPQEESRIVRPGYDEWIKWGLHDPTLLHDACFIAARGDEYVGWSEWYQDPGSDVLQGGLLGVRPASRRQGISLALMLRGIAFARAHGCPILKTCTAVQNAPMQALFNKLGFARDPEWLQCQKDEERS